MLAGLPAPGSELPSQASLRGQVEANSNFFDKLVFKTGTAILFGHHSVAEGWCGQRKCSGSRVPPSRPPSASLEGNLATRPNWIQGLVGVIRWEGMLPGDEDSLERAGVPRGWGLWPLIMLGGES